MLELGPEDLSPEELVRNLSSESPPPDQQELGGPHLELELQEEKVEKDPEEEEPEGGEPHHQVRGLSAAWGAESDGGEPGAEDTSPPVPHTGNGDAGGPEASPGVPAPAVTKTPVADADADDAAGEGQDGPPAYEEPGDRSNLGADCGTWVDMIHSVLLPTTPIPDQETRGLDGAAPNQAAALREEPEGRAATYARDLEEQVVQQQKADKKERQRERWRQAQARKRDRTRFTAQQLKDALLQLEGARAESSAAAEERARLAAQNQVLLLEMQRLTKELSQAMDAAAELEAARHANGNPSLPGWEHEALDLEAQIAEYERYEAMNTLDDYPGFKRDHLTPLFEVRLDQPADVSPNGAVELVMENRDDPTNMDESEHAVLGDEEPYEDPYVIPSPAPLQNGTAEIEVRRLVQAFVVDGTVRVPGRGGVSADQDTRFFLDSGSTTNLVGEEYVRRHGLEIVPFPHGSRPRLTGADGGEFQQL